MYNDIFKYTKKFDGMCYQVTITFKSENIQNLSIESRGNSLTITGKIIDADNKLETLFHLDTTIPGYVKNRGDAFMSGKDTLIIRYELGHELPIHYEQ